MNKQTRQIYFSEFTARFCTWTVLSQLLIHLIHIHWQNTAAQFYIVGLSISLLYISAIFGGIIRDYLFDGQIVIMFGIGLIGAGSLLLLAHSAFFYTGLSLVLMGAGMVTPNTPLLLSSSSNEKHEYAFTILYAVTNSGIILGSILSGFVQTYFSWECVLILNEFFIGIWLMSCISSAWIHSLRRINLTRLYQFIGIVIFAVFFTYFYFTRKNVSTITMLITGLCYLGFIIFLMFKNPEIKKQLTAIIFLTMCAITFFSGEFQVASTLVDYANHFVKLTFSDIKIAPGSLLALESIFVVLGAFIIARIKWLSSVTGVQTKVAIGLLFGVLAFVVLYISNFSAMHHSISVLWIILAFLLLGLGDVYLMPPIMAYVANHAPLKYKGTLMAGMYFSISLSGYFSGLIGATLSSSFLHANLNLHFYRAGFEVMILILGSAAILVFAARVVQGIFAVSNAVK